MRTRAVAVLFMVVAASTVLAQDRASLVGTVQDGSGGVIPGVEVVLESLETGLRREVITGDSGAYTFSLVPIGVYSVKASFPGFQSVSVPDLRLGAGDRRTLDLVLNVSAEEVTVIVEDTRAPLERSSAALGTVIGGEQLNEIPVNGRHWASLMALAPGAINTGEGNQQSIRFVGRARDDNNWTLDGLDSTGVKDPRQESALRLVVSSDAIAEFRVNSTLYTAETGGGAGAQVSMVSRAGTNEFHGSVFEYFRNDALDSRNPFDLGKEPFRLNQFGGNIGGPIARNKTFFFANYEGLRQRVGQVFRNNVPSAALRARATDPVVRSILEAYPLGTESTSDPDVDRALASVRQIWREDAFTVRVDHHFSEKDTIYGRYNFDDGTITQPRSVILSDQQKSFFRPSNFVTQWQRVFTPTLVHEVKAGFNRSALNRYNYGPFNEVIAVPGLSTLNDSSFAVETGTSYSLIDNLVITRGRHTLKLGTEVRRVHVNVADTATPGIDVEFADIDGLLANEVDGVSIVSGSPVLGTRKWYFFGFVHDDFKVLPELTFNLGLRYEYYGVNSEVKDRYRVFDMYECQGFCPPGTPWYYPDRNNFDPRLGIAWAPKFLGGGTVIRTGIGVYHGPGQVDDKNAALDNVAERFRLTPSEIPDLSYPIEPYLDQAASEGATPRSLQRDIRDLYSVQWGLSVQQDLPARFMMQVGYVGSSASKVTTRTYINNLDPATRQRPLPEFGRMDEKRGDGNSNFNALQVSLHRRVAGGLNLGTEYMWSHSINDNSTGGGEGQQPQNNFCRACDRGNSNTDIRHTVTTNWIYRLPFGQEAKFLNSGFASRILGGWELSGIWTARTGRPLTIYVSRSSRDVPDGNTRFQRPDMVSGVSIYPEGGSTFYNWFNPAAFAIPARGAWGNAGRTIGRGPGLWQVDLSLKKRSRIAEEKAIIFAAEMFNVFNRTQPGDPGNTLTTQASFGLVTSGLNRTIGTGTSRQIQLALRFTF